MGGFFRKIQTRLCGTVQLFATRNRINNTIVQWILFYMQYVWMPNGLHKGCFLNCCSSIVSGTRHFYLITKFVSDVHSFLFRFDRYCRAPLNVPRNDFSLNELIPTVDRVKNVKEINTLVCRSLRLFLPILNFMDNRLVRANWRGPIVQEKSTMHTYIYFTGTIIIKINL